MGKIVFVIVLMILVSCQPGSKNQATEQSATPAVEVVETTLNIGGMHCDMCVASIEKGVSELAGIEFVKANLGDSTAVVKFDASKIQLAEIEQAIEKRGYTIKGDL